MDNQHLPPGFWTVTLLWVKTNAPSIYGSLAACAMATMITLRDGKSWFNAILSGGICLLIALSVINSLEYFGWKSDHALLAGVIVGGIGVERCLAIMNVFASMRTNTQIVEEGKSKNE